MCKEALASVEQGEGVRAGGRWPKGAPMVGHDLR